ncbi:MAG TPA: hypothetical protein VLF91_04080 [Candidatus Saccharimonadales bacterium]|nr:hypothetical protein [Candidatus Saccharimonadales bacterium]
MSEYLDIGERSPEELLALAASMAQRSIREQQWHQSVLAQSLPVPPAPPTEVAQTIQTSATVAMLRALEDPEAVIDVPGLVMGTIDDTTIASMLRSQNREPTPEGITRIRTMVDIQVRTLYDQFASDTNAQESLRRSLAAAQAIADAHGAEICEVFSSDNLYAEYARSSYGTPEEYAARTAAQLEKFNKDAFLTNIKLLVASMLQAEVDAGRLAAADYATEEALTTEMLLHDPEVQADIAASMARIRSAAQEVTARGIERFWGTEAVNHLKALGTLATAETTEPLPNSLRQQQSYNDIIKTVAMEQGWNPDELTITQMRFIHASPAMERFLQEL